MESILDRTNEESLRDILLENLLYISQRAEPRDILSYLQKGHVLSGNEVEEILNPYIHVTRQHRAMQMVDVVSRKGVSGMNKFLDILELRYSHIFTHITLQEARKEPADWLKSVALDWDSGSLTSTTVRKLLSGFEEDFMTWRKERRPKYCNNNSSQSDNTDELYNLFVELEKENDELRRYITELEQDNVKLVKQQRMRHWMKDKRTQQLEADLKCANTEVELLNARISDLERPLLQETDRSLDRGHSNRKIVKNVVKDFMEYSAQLQQQFNELEATCATYKTLLEEMRKEKDELQAEHEKLWKQNFESDKLAEFTREQTRFYEREVSSLRHELLLLRSTSTRSGSAVNRGGYVGPSQTLEVVADGATASQRVAKHPLAEENGDCPAELRTRRLNLKDYPHLRRPKDGQNGDDNLNESLRRYAANKPWSRFFSYIEVSEPDIGDVVTVEPVVMRQDAVNSMLEPHIIQRSFLSKISDSNADVDPKRLGTIKKKREQSMVEVTMSSAELKAGGRVTLIGGNYSGIFVHKSLCGAVVEGDQLLLLQWKENGGEKKRVSLDGITMEDLVIALNHITGQVVVTRLPNAIGYKYLMQQTSSSSMYNGDLFCVMFHDSKQHRVLGPEFDLLKPSNVLLVMNSRHREEEMWYGEMLNPVTGGKRGQGVFTSLTHLQRDAGKEARGSAGSDSLKRGSGSSLTSMSSSSSSSSSINGLCSASSLFDYVIPYKAKAKRPVLIYCAPDYATDLMRELLELPLFVAAEYSYKSDNVDQVAGELMRSPLEVSQRMRNKQILHYEGDEKNFVCLLTRRFVDLILKQANKHVLLNVPVVCIRRMYAVGIYPIVFVVKSNQMTSSLKEEEELEDGHNSHQYEAIYYEDGRSMRDVARMVEKETKVHQEHLIWRQCDIATSPVST